MLEVLVFKNAAECTSQRLKWTSGARDMILVFVLVQFSSRCKAPLFAWI